MIGRLVSWWRSRRQPEPPLLKGKLACEACETEVATVVVFSELEQRDVHFCEWCWRRFKRRNEARSIPRTRRRKKTRK